MVNVLITGVDGFLGTALKQHLAGRKGVHVVGVSRRKQNKLKSTVVCDLNHEKDVARLLKSVNPHLIFHFAGGRFEDDQITYDANFNTTRVLLRAVEANTSLSSRVIIPSSAAEYGNIGEGKLITEERTPKPLGWYGSVKLLQTQLGLFYARRGLDVVVVRMFNICGEATPPHLAIGRFARQIVAIEQGAPPILHTRNLDGKRDFIDVEDACRGLWEIAHKGKPGQIYNLCSGKPSCIRHLLTRMLSFAQVKGIIIDEHKQDASPSFDIIGCNAKFCKLTGWSPRVSLDQSLRNTLASYRRHAKAHENTHRP